MERLHDFFCKGCVIFFILEWLHDFLGGCVIYFGRGYVISIVEKLHDFFVERLQDFFLERLHNFCVESRVG